jgi:hypothetical protein
MPPQDGYFFFWREMLPSSYIRSVLTDERFLHFQLRRDDYKIKEIFGKSDRVLRTEELPETVEVGSSPTLR